MGLKPVRSERARPAGCPSPSKSAQLRPSQKNELADSFFSGWYGKRAQTTIWCTGFDQAKMKLTIIRIITGSPVTRGNSAEVAKTVTLSEPGAFSLSNPDN